MLRSGSICLSFLYNYLVSDVKTTEDEDENGNKLIQKADKIKCLSDTFQS